MTYATSHNPTLEPRRRRDLQPSPVARHQTRGNRNLLEVRGGWRGLDRPVRPSGSRECRQREAAPRGLAQAADQLTGGAALPVSRLFRNHSLSITIAVLFLVPGCFRRFWAGSSTSRSRSRWREARGLRADRLVWSWGREELAIRVSAGLRIHCADDVPDSPPQSRVAGHRLRHRGCPTPHRGAAGADRGRGACHRRTGGAGAHGFGQRPRPLGVPIRCRRHRLRPDHRAPRADRGTGHLLNRAFPALVPVHVTATIGQP